MTFAFFTFGGSQFWEDVFFYQKWRIQRNCRTKAYRLLDNWDIKRAEGSFEQCRKAFVKCIEVYEIPRQSGELIILLHGLGETKNVFRKLWKNLTANGYNVAAINYPSTRKPMKYHIRQLEFFLNHCEDINKVSFITKGAGCLLLRMLIANTYGWQDNFQINKVINVNPINRGSDMFEILSRFAPFNFILGPMLKECTPKSVQSISKLPAETECGIIFCETWGQKIFYPIIERFKGLPLKSEMSESDFADKDNIIRIENSYANIFNNPEVSLACLNFLKKGNFKI